MKWTKEQVEELKECCKRDVPNAALAVRFNCTREEIYAKRTALGITRAKLGFVNNKPTKPTLVESAPAHMTEPEPTPEPRVIPRVIDNTLRVLAAKIAAESKNVPELNKLGEEIAKAVQKYKDGENILATRKRRLQDDRQRLIDSLPTAQGGEKAQLLLEMQEINRQLRSMDT